MCKTAHAPNKQVSIATLFIFALHTLNKQSGVDATPMLQHRFPITLTHGPAKQSFHYKPPENPVTSPSKNDSWVFKCLNKWKGVNYGQNISQISSWNPPDINFFLEQTHSTVVVQRGFQSANHVSTSANWNVTINIPHARPPTAEVWVQCFPHTLKHSNGAQDCCIPNKTFKKLTACVHWWQETSAAVKWGKWWSSVHWIRLEPSCTPPANTMPQGG